MDLHIIRLNIWNTIVKPTWLCEVCYVYETKNVPHQLKIRPCILLHWSPSPLCAQIISKSPHPLNLIVLWIWAKPMLSQIYEAFFLSIRPANLFEICRVEMKRKIELREHGRWALFRPNWILCNAKLNQNTIFIVSTDRAKIDASLIFSFYRCKYRILFSLSASDILPYLYYSISILNG